MDLLIDFPNDLFCESCHLVVRQHDPEAVILNNKAYHLPCLRKEERKWKKNSRGVFGQFLALLSTSKLENIASG